MKNYPTSDAELRDLVQTGNRFIWKLRELRTSVAADPGRNSKAILLALIALGEDDHMELEAELSTLADFNFDYICRTLLGLNGERIPALVQQLRGTLG